jgi:hypothetical protein
VPQVTQVADAYAVGREKKDDVLPALQPLAGIVVTADAQERDAPDRVFAHPPQHHRVTRHRVHGAVVEVFMADGHDVGAQGREAKPQGTVVRVSPDGHTLSRGDVEGGLSQPENLHEPSSRTGTSGATPLPCNYSQPSTPACFLMVCELRSGVPGRGRCGGQSGRPCR